MGQVIADMSMSLDGFFEDASGSIEHLFASIAPETEAAAERERGRSAASVLWCRTADCSTGNRAGADSTLSAFRCSSRPTACPTIRCIRSTALVTDRVASTVEQARAVAGHRSVAVASAEVARRCIDLELLE